MASGNIKGIVIEISGNTDSLQNSLKDVNNESKKIQNELKEVERALKLDPSNVTLVNQKMDLLADAVNASTTKLDGLRAAQAQVEAQFARGDIGEEQYRAFQRELSNTEASLRNYQTQMQSLHGEQDRLGQNQRDLQTYLNATGQSVDDLSGLLGNRLTTAIKNGTATTDQLEMALNRIGRQAGHSGEEMEQFRQTLRTVDNGSSLDEVREDLNRIGQAAQEVEVDMEGLKDGIKNIALGTSAALTGLGGGALLAAGQFDNAAGQIQAALGVTADEAAALEDKATSVWKSGFGESLEEVSNGLIRVKQNFQNLDDGEIEEVTKNSLALAKSFDSDVNEVTRAASNLMTNFGVSSEEAFDMMAKGAQNGLNFSNEMFDNLAEYAPLWSDMGFSIEEMFGILEVGAQNGVYNLDYLNDVTKEFGILTTDGSKATAEAMGSLSKETQSLFEDYRNGKATVADMSESVAADLMKIDDKVKRNEIGVSLWGTKWEDLGGDVVLSMFNAETAMTDFEGAMNSVSQAQEQTFGQRWESFVRTATASLEPLGKILLDLAEQWLPKIISVVERLATWFSNLSPVMQGVTVAVGAIVAAIGPFLVVAGMISSAIGNIIPIFVKLLPVFKGAGVAIAGMSAPVAIAIAAVTALIAIAIALYKNWDEVSAWLKKIWETIKSNVSSAFKQMGDSISKAWESVKSSTTSVWNAIKSALNTAWNAIKNSVTTTFNSIKTGITNVWDTIKNTTSNVWNGIKSTLSSLWNGLKSSVTTAFNGIKSAIDTVWNGVKTFTTNTWNTIKTSISSVVESIVSTVKTKFNSIKDSMTKPIETAKNTIKSIIDTIKGFFSNLSLKLPEIKMPKLPKFKLSGDFSLNPPSVPKLSVSWNALGGIFNKPTIFNTANAGLQGVGEAGPEAILPLNAKTLAGIGKGIAEQMGTNGMPTTIIVQSVLDGRVIAETITPLVSQNQYNSASLAGLRKGVSL